MSTAVADVPNCLNKSAAELEKFKKPELISMFIDSGDFIIKHLLNENSKLKDRIGVLERVTTVQSEAIDRKTRFQTGRSRTQLRLNDQYSRELNVEFCGIPTNITQGNLQNSVINICDKIGVHVEEGDIQACHRMYLKPRDNGVARTLVRFLGKKTSGDILRSKKKLKDLNYVDLAFSAETKIFANDNLCPYFKKLLGIASHLRRDRLIASCWSFKGLVFI